MTPPPLRHLLAGALAWRDAHVDFGAAVDGIPPETRGVRPNGLPHSAWELVEHIRLTQRDILDFCRDPEYEEPRWPEDYWPREQAPESEGAWEESIAAVRADRAALQELASDPDLDLFAPIPHGTGQTYLRELLVVTDHTSYHVGQLVLVRRALGSWAGA